MEIGDRIHRPYTAADPSASSLGQTHLEGKDKIYIERACRKSLRPSCSWLAASVRGERVNSRMICGIAEGKGRRKISLDGLVGGCKGFTGTPPPAVLSFHRAIGGSRERCRLDAPGELAVRPRATVG